MTKKQSGVLATVTETFNIFNDGRKYNTAPQKYALSSVQKVCNSGPTIERINLKEAIGYYGHGIREKADKLEPAELEIIMIDGKPTVVHTEVAIRCIAFTCDDKGNVTHTEDFLDTNTGKAAYAAYLAGNGGFSWALGGSDGRGAPSIARQFFGFDYVNRPNFIPKHRMQLLAASVQSAGDDLLLAAMKEQGFEDDAAIKLVDSFKNDQHEAVGIDDLVVADLIASEAKATKINEKRNMLLASVMEKSPFLFNEGQKNALLNMNTQEDAETVTALFSSMKQTDFSQLPHVFEVRKPEVKIPMTPRLGGMKWDLKQ